MAQNELEEGQGLNNVLSRAYGVQGAPAPFMASEIFPNLVLGNDRPEWKYLCNCRLGRGYQRDTAVAAQRSMVGLHNPASSGVIVVVSEISLPNRAGADLDTQLLMGIGPTTDAAGVDNVFADSRFGYDTTPTAQIFTRTSATLFGSFCGLYSVPDGTTVRVPGPFVLGPNGFVMARGASVNTDVEANFVWYEYAAAGGELRDIKQ